MKLVAITSCPTGIAHSQMAAENLEQTADRLGHDIKVEVQGAMGAENELSSEDVAEADAVIVASDTSVSRDRFEGKPLVKGTVKDGVNDPEGLIEQAAELVESGESGTVELDDAAAEGDDESLASQAEPEKAKEPQGQRRGGDPEKSLINRLKRLFS
ncbi:PTS fructose transporter subunit IIB [Halopelagius fulvigenes]|uniref:PTS fructose transporter subunit IIB n=1 Tax=Halopelagius fulvigenes TaxID=1198324 RepID=A0ABD5TY23_9EURY